MGIANFLVHKAMNDSVLGVELVGDTIEVLRVPGLIASKYGMGYMVSKLNHAGSARVYEQWRVSQLRDDSPLSAEGPELYRHFLKRRLVSALVKYYEPSLCVAVGA